MTWTYTNCPTEIDLDAIRLLIGDTNVNDQILSDEELEFFIQNFSPIRLSAIEACLAIVAKFSRLADEKVGQVSVSLSQKAEQYKKLADKLKARGDLDPGCPIAGGITISDKNIEELNTDRVQPIFTRHMQDNPRNAHDVADSYDEDGYPD